MKATKEHTVLSNLLNRNLKQNIPVKVLLTDITYLFYGKDKKAYLSTIKDEAYIKSCETLEDLKKEIKQYILYYNKYRYQWNLKKMTPVQYRNHLLNSA